MKTKNLFFLLLATLFCTTTIAQVNLTQGLIMYLPFTGNATDVSGNTNVVSVNGPVLTTDRFGTTNAAYRFDGVNDFMSIALGTGMKPQYPFSFSCWVKPITTNAGITNYLFANDYVSPGDNYYGSFYNVPQGTFQANVGDGGTPSTSSRQTKSTNQTIQNGTWVHLAAVVTSGTSMKLYINCTEVVGTYSGSGSGLVYSTGGGSIGRGNGGGGENFLNADLDEMRFYNRALNDQEIAALYTYPNPPGTPVTLGSNVQYLCPNGSLTLTPSPSGLTIDQWSDGSTGPDLTVNCPGEYWVSVTDACGITTYDTVDVQMAPAVQINLGPDRVVCPGTTVNLNGTAANATSYIWSNNSIQPQINVTAGGNYWVQVSNQCYSSRDTINVAFNSPAINLTTTGSSPICYGDTATLTVTAPLSGATLIWSNGDVGTQATIYGPGVYWVKAIDNCTLVVDTILVNLDKGCPDTTVALIEHFNGDAKFLKDYYVNDAWVITNLPQHNSVIVYDVTGRLVFNTSNYQNNWRPETTNGIYYYQLYSNQKLVTNGRLLIIKP